MAFSTESRTTFLRRIAVRLGPHALLILIASLHCTSLGCRSLRSRRHTQQLSDARQNSLRGAEKLQQNKLKDAEFLFSEALRQSAADERAQWGMSEVLWQQGEHERAIEHMARAAQISGDNPDLIVRLGEMNFEAGFTDQALQQADLALDRQRRHPGAWALRGKVLHQRQQLDEALECYQRALIGQPSMPDVQLAIAEIYQATGRPQRAYATLEYMTDNQAEERISSKAWMVKGLALADLGEEPAARECLKNAALCAGDEETELLLGLAESQIAAGDLAEARICLGRVFRHDPNNQHALQLQNTLNQSFREFTLPAVLTGFEQGVAAGR